jgi:hypothetical protein
MVFKHCGRNKALQDENEEAKRGEEESEDDDDPTPPLRNAQAYARHVFPSLWSRANFLMHFVRRRPNLYAASALSGLDNGGSVGRAANSELARLAPGEQSPAVYHYTESPVPV